MAPYDRLNVALHVGDDAAAVIENRRRFCDAVGVSALRLCSTEQVHGDVVYRVTEADAGRGALAYSDAIAKTDALMTNVPDVPLLLCYADCTPVLLFDPVHRACAVVHGGWKGTVRGIVGKTLSAMHFAYGTQSADCLAAIGPAIGPCCYEVGADVAAQFQDAYPQFAAEILQRKDESAHLHLWRANELQLIEAGVLPEHIDCAAVCTACNSEVFYSYRAADGKTGRIGAVMAIRSGR